MNETPKRKPETPLPQQPESIPLHFDLKARWDAPPSPEEFMFPYVDVTIGIWNWSTGENESRTIRTLGSHDPSDVLANLYGNVIHPSMRHAIERPVFTALMVIRDTEAYKQAHDAWRVWKQGQPSNFHDRIIKQAKGFDVNAERPKRPRS